MNVESLIWFIPLPPLLAFFLIVLLANKSNRASHSLAILAVLMSWAAGLYVVWQALQQEHLGEHPFEAAINWFATGSGFFQIGVLIDPLSAATLFFVAWKKILKLILLAYFSTSFHRLCFKTLR